MNTMTTMNVVEAPNALDNPALQTEATIREPSQNAALIARRVVYGGTAVYAVALCAAVTLFYLSFSEARLDLGDMVQAIWTTAHGHFLEFTTPNGVQMSRLGAHVDPFLVLFAPLWLVVPSPLVLLIVQVVAVALGALPAYWLAEKHLQSPRAAAHMAIGYLLFPATQFNAFTPGDGFHPVSFALPLLVYAIWFLDEGRLIPFAAFALLAASTKEEIPAAIGCLGIWFAVTKGKRLAGTVIALLGFGVTAVNFLVIVPHFSPPGVNLFALRYADVGGTASGILHKAVSDPIALVQAAATWHKAGYLLLLLMPFLGLWALEPLLALGAAPDLIINLLSSTTGQASLEFQYNAGIVPFLLAATIVGIKRLKRHPDRVTFYAFVALAGLALYSPIVLWRSEIGHVVTARADRSARAHAVGMIPDGVPVAATNQLAGYLSNRRYVYVFPYIRDARWVVVDSRDQTTVADERSYRRLIRQMDARQGWDIVYRSHGVQVLRKLPATP